MSKTIAVAGKGGTGKTSITSLIIRYLLRSGHTPVLAVDADPNANLGDSLGLKVGRTVGSLIVSFNEDKINIPPGMTKESYLEFRMNDAIVESRGLDLLTMGRGEGPECYCYPNLMLRKFMATLIGNYAFVVMDNEAGMEHLSRRTTDKVDELLLVSDHTMKGVRTLARLRELVAEVKLVVKRESVVINFVPGQIDPLIEQEMARLGLKAAVTVPVDKAVRDSDMQFLSLLELPDTSPAVQAVDSLMNRLLAAEQK